MAGIYEGLDGVPAGSRVLDRRSPRPTGSVPTRPRGVLEETDTLLFFAEIHEVRIPLARAEGEAVAPVAGLPTVELAEDGAPTITVPDGEPPTELVVQPLIEGTGAVSRRARPITVHYTGVLWDDGTVFDSSWESGAPATFEIGTGAVIPGWDEGLVGQTVGRRSCSWCRPPRATREGSRTGRSPPTDTLVFVVDILDAQLIRQAGQPDLDDPCERGVEAAVRDPTEVDRLLEPIEHRLRHPSAARAGARRRPRPAPARPPPARSNRDRHRLHRRRGRRSSPARRTRSRRAAARSPPATATPARPSSVRPGTSRWPTITPTGVLGEERVVGHQVAACAAAPAPARWRRTLVGVGVGVPLPGEVLQHRQHARRRAARRRRRPPWR